MVPADEEEAAEPAAQSRGCPVVAGFFRDLLETDL